MRARRWSGRLGALVAVAALGAGLSACGGGGSYKVTANFDDVGDSQPRGGVQVADVRVGTIDKIELTKDFKAKVTMTLRKSVKLPKDSTALVRTSSLLGEKFVEIRANADPVKGPFLENGDVMQKTAEAPELEFVADSAITVLGGLVASDIATLNETGSEALAGRGADLNALLGDFETISATLASRTGAITSIIDSIDVATATLAAGSGELANLLTNLAETTTILVDNRQRAIDALANLARLARVQNETLSRYRDDITRQIHQIDTIVAIVASEVNTLGNLVDYVDRFAHALPTNAVGDFFRIYPWVVACPADPQASAAGC